MRSKSLASAVRRSKNSSESIEKSRFRHQKGQKVERGFLPFLIFERAVSSEKWLFFFGSQIFGRREFSVFESGCDGF